MPSRRAPLSMAAWNIASHHSRGRRRVRAWSARSSDAGACAGNPGQPKGRRSCHGHRPGPASTSNAPASNRGRSRGTAKRPWKPSKPDCRKNAPRRHPSTAPARRRHGHYAGGLCPAPCQYSDARLHHHRRAGVAVLARTRMEVDGDGAVAVAVAGQRSRRRSAVVRRQDGRRPVQRRAIVRHVALSVAVERDGARILLRRQCAPRARPRQRRLGGGAANAGGPARQSFQVLRIGCASVLNTTPSKSSAVFGANSR